MSSDISATPRGARAAGLFALREAGVDDAEEIEAIHWSAREAVYDGRVADWPPTGPDRSGRIERWRSWLASPSVTCFVAEEDGRMLGFVTLRASQDEDAGHGVAEMPTLYVDPKAWRRGVGELLSRAAVERAAEMGFNELTLWVVELNEQARAFYHAFGFHPDGASQVDEDTTERLVAHRYRLDLGAPA
jgi:GNAT superfamily N-acetyltransferase